MSTQRIALWTFVLIGFVAAVGYRTSVMREHGPPPTPRLVFIMGGSGPFWQLTANGAKAGAKKYDAQLTILMPAAEESVSQQTEILQGLDMSELDGVAISPLDAKGQTDLINQLANKKIVVTFDSDAPESTRQSHVGTSNFSAGRACARVVSKALPNGGKIAVLLVNSTKENLIDRKGGFRERITQISDDGPQGSAPKYTIVGFFEDNGKEVVCERNIRDALTNHPDLACFVGMNAQHGPILLRVLKEEGKLGKIKLVTFDTEKETLDGIEDGYIDATLAQDPFGCGYKTARLLSVLVRGDPFEVPIVGTGAYYSGVEVVDRENLAEFRELLRKQQEAAEEQNNSPPTKKTAS